MNKFVVFILLLFSTWASGNSDLRALDPVYDEFEGEALVAKLLDDGEIVEASATFEHLKLSSNSLKARILNEQGTPEKVPDVLDAGFELARSYALRGLWHKCSQVFIFNNETLKPEQIGLMIDCHVKAGEMNKAYLLIQNPVDPLLRIKAFDFYEKLKLYGSALEILITTPPKNIPVEVLIEWAGRLPESEQQKALEFIKLQYVDEPRVLLAWVEFYYQKSFGNSALEGLRRIAQLDLSFAPLAGEALRAEAHFEEAKYYALISNHLSESLKLRMNIAIDEENWVELQGLAGPFERSSFYNEENFIYAIAYSYKLSGDHAKSLFWGKRLEKEDMRIKFEELFKLYP